jgi:hypothetical protein
MIRISDARHGVVRRLVRSFSLAAAAILALSAVPGQRAEALSLINPGAVPTAKYASEGLTTEVRGHGGHGGGGYHGGGGGGGYRGGGAVYHGGGFRTGAVYHGGGFRSAHVFRGGGFRHGGFAFRHHRHHRHFFYGPSYYGPYYYSYRPCRTVWTYYGPRRICHYRHWRHHHRRHHHYRGYW